MADKDSANFDPSYVLTAIKNGRTEKSYCRNEVIFAQGDPADSVFYVERGKVKVAVASTQGREAVIAILSKGAFVGESCLIGNAMRLATASALTDCALVRIGKKAMQRFLREEPRFAEQFTTYLLARNRRIEDDLVDHLFNPSEKRLARMLLLLANVGRDGEGRQAITDISQDVLAKMVGTTRPRITFFMNKFKKLGLIDYDGGLRVHSSLLNVVLGE